MTQVVTLREAEGQLAQLLERAHSGEEILLSQEGKVIGRLVSVDAPLKKRQPGSARGQFTIEPDAWEPLEDFADNL